jgi:hypothetical protein
MSLPPSRPARRFATAIIIPLLFLSAASALPTARLNLQRTVRLLNERRLSPDIGEDLHYRELARWLPPGGLIGFRNVSRRDTDLVRFRLQYALPPRRIAPTIRHEYAIEYGPAGSRPSLSRHADFVLVGGPSDELRVYRRVRP